MSHLKYRYRAESKQSGREEKEEEEEEEVAGRRRKNKKTRPKCRLGLFYEG